MQVCFNYRALRKIFQPKCKLFSQVFEISFLGSSGTVMIVLASIIPNIEVRRLGVRLDFGVRFLVRSHCVAGPVVSRRDAFFQLPQLY